MAIRAKYRLKLLIESLVELEKVPEEFAKMILQTYDNDIEQAKIDGRNEVCDRIEKSMKIMKGERGCKSQAVL